jgi:hypothetical protein
MSDLETLISDVNDAGFLLANLFQLKPDLWQANLRTAEGKLSFEYGRGSTPYYALLQAFTMMGEGQEALTSTSRLLVNPVAEPKTTGASLLATLNLRKVEPIRLGVKT